MNGHCSKCFKKVSKGVVSQALKGFGCKLSKVMSVSSICRQNQSGAKKSTHFIADYLLRLKNNPFLRGAKRRKKNRNDG